jgi:RimJ/RimL family protein N-acetyltransferase
VASLAERRPIIRGERVHLRPAERSDLPTFVRWFNDARVAQNIAIRAPMSLVAEEGWFERMLAAQGKTDYHWVICLLEDDRPIGTAGLHSIDRENGNAEFGIAIGETAEWGKGYATDVLQAVCAFGFDELRLERIELEYFAGNDRGRRAYEKAGFVHEGTRRRARFAGGRYVDVHVMGMLRDEWEASRTGGSGADGRGD